MSLIIVMILFCFVWPEWMIKKKKVKQGVPPQASLLVHYLILMEMVVFIYVIKMLFADGQNNFMLFFCNEFHKLLSISEPGTIAGSICGKMPVGASKRTSEKAPSNDGLNTPKVEGVHSHE